MSTLQNKTIRASHVFFQNDRLYVHLSDGREISVPLTWFPRLLHATNEQRRDWELMVQGLGIHYF